MSLRRQIVLGAALVAVAVLIATVVAPGPDIGRQGLPDKFSNSEFWSLVVELSEPGGYFRSDNLVSNESAFQRVIPDLKKKVRPGGVYLGVGPDQNFTYIAALRPKVAFIVDIRRQNMLLHLMYKALFELSNNRAEFLSKLFARPAPPDLTKDITTQQLFAAFDQEDSDSDLAKENLDAILKQLRGQHHFDLAMDDAKTIDIVYNAFVSGGPEIRYSFPNQYAWRRFPSYSDLMLETDGTTENGGENHSYMSSEDNFQTIKNMETENRIIPIVGDFAGDKALSAVGSYIRKHGATITTFYTSNVEFYLFQTDDWRKFVKTLSDLPVDSGGVFVRSYFNNYGQQFQNPPGWLTSPPQYTLIDSIPSFVSAFASGHINSYFDVVRRSVP